MKLRAFAVAVSVLALVALAGTGVAAAQPTIPGEVSTQSAAFSQPPQFTGYFQCFNGHVFADFTDPDGDDTRLNATLAVWRASAGGWTLHPMTNTGDTVHGVFFFIKLSDHGINAADVDWYAVGATDQAGDWSGWSMADRNCKLL
ncbi:hypothetical protein FKR81_03460 [Lentzea tibetensis]|uniref:Secreted protein n=1 Tax=Lentzea tibetensis TaxID=2591470 RepID=A0A563F1G9_9PSEU|nr:hypothetical protein [Lentzea tibetensis]TWP53827.1 hypothetical protein FKR81_03460 [Lentzea tibetensis]